MTMIFSTYVSGFTVQFFVQPIYMDYAYGLFFITKNHTKIFSSLIQMKQNWTMVIYRWSWPTFKIVCDSPVSKMAVVTKKRDISRGIKNLHFYLERDIL